ncbi:MAG TPA: HAD-IA family hydrolase [Polyangia bacterium]|nr:HAD-IA family hydrolase [Polyangia bacterium]
MAPAAVLFDAGHTLIEPRDQALAEAARAAGLPVSATAIARAFRLAIRALNLAPPADPPQPFRPLVAQELARLGAGGRDAEAAFWAVLDQYNAAHTLWTKPVEGALATLAELKRRNIRTAVVSNSDGHVVHYLAQAGLLPLLDVVVDSEVVGVEKPDQRIFRHALEKLAVEPSGVPFVGDRYDVDVLGARTVGMRGLLYDPEGGEPPGVCEVLRRLEALLDLL